jgi:hypothetical protein
MSAMKALDRLEGILQDLMERPQWLLSPRHVHPLAIASALTRAMETELLPVGDRVLAPNRYTVRLNPADFEQFAPVRRTIEREMGLYLARAAEERTIHLPGVPEVSCAADAGVRPGDIQVDAAFDEGRPERGTAPLTIQTAMSGFTERIDRASISPPSTPSTNGHAELDLLGANGQVMRSFPVQAPMVTIGRRSGNDVPLVDLEVSRQHARIDFVAPYYYVSDLGSTNGTRVNGRMVAGRQPLRDGDVIEVGSQRLRFHHYR